MKKLLLSTLILLLILGAIFHQQILTTVDFYQDQQENAETLSKATLTWKQIPFSSSRNSRVASDTLTFKTLQLPVPFVSSKREGADAALALGRDSSISIAPLATAEVFFRMYGFSDIEKSAACAFLAKTSGRGACNANYDFYRAFLELNKTDVHIFTSIDHKELYQRLLKIRAGLLPSNLASGFETKNVRGFLFTLDSDNFVAHLFDGNDEMYELTFTNLDQGDIAFVLSNTTLTK